MFVFIFFFWSVSLSNWIQNSFLKVVRMPPTKRVTPNQLPGRSLSVGVGLDDVKLQFPPLPQEWKDRYVPGQMFKYQASLPKLPVPPLQQTLEKYITNIKVMNHNMLQHTISEYRTVWIVPGKCLWVLKILELSRAHTLRTALHLHQSESCMHLLTLIVG